MTVRNWAVTLAARDASGTTVYRRYAQRAAESGGYFHEARVQQPGLIRESLFGPGRTRGPLEIGAGVVVLLNADGALDELRDLNFDGQFFTAQDVGTPALGGIYYTQGILEQAVFDENTVTLQVRDYRHRYDVELLTARYTGVDLSPFYAPGAWADVTDDIAMSPRPALYGIARNFEPVLVDDVRLIYQVDGQRGFLTGWSLDVYDARSALTQGADYADEAAILATAPAAGEFRVWPAGGVFRLGSSPTGIVTCDAENPPMASPYNASTVVNILRALAFGSSGHAYVYVDNDPAAGIYLREQISRLEAINRVVQSISAFFSYRTQPQTETLGNRPWVGQLSPPDSPYYTPSRDPALLDRSVILPGSLRQMVPGEEQRGLPVWRVNVRYRRNYRVMSATDLAGVALADQLFCSQEWRTASYEDAAVLGQFPDALELTVDSLIDLQADAEAEAERLFGLFGTRRRVFTCTVPTIAAVNQYADMNGLNVGRQVTLQYPRFGLDAGVTMIILSAELDAADDRVNLQVWG